MEQQIHIPWPGWEMVKLIGRGGFGAVYEIRRNIGGAEERSAMKVISIPQNQSDIEELYTEGLDQQTVTDRYESYKNSIVNEYAVMATLKGNPNVVYCDDYREIRHADGIGWDIYIKMELLTPMTKVFHGENAEVEALKLGIDLSSALQACRQHKILHRDIKPQNIFVTEQGSYKLGDFGIARTAEGTTSGTKIGTYKYMAPEVYNNQPYSAKADQYSLGMVLYWMLNERRLPFLPTPSTQSQEEEARRRRMSGEALPAPKHGSPALKQVVLRACAYDPKARFANMDQLLQALQAAEAGKAYIPPVQPDPEPDDDFGETEGRTYGVKTPANTSSANDDTQGKTYGPQDQDHVQTQSNVDSGVTEGPVLSGLKQPGGKKGRFCPNCGKPLAAGVAFCTSCGHGVKEKKNKVLPILLAVVGCLAVALTVLLVTGGSNDSADPQPAAVTADESGRAYEWAVAYADKLRELYDPDAEMEQRFLLVDINDDDVPELVYAPGAAHFIGVIVYTFYDNTVVEAGMLGAWGMIEVGTNRHFVRDADVNNMGNKSTHIYQLQNDTLVEVESFFDGHDPVTGEALIFVGDVEVSRAQYEEQLSLYEDYYYQVGFENGFEMLPEYFDELENSPSVYIYG